MRMVIYAAVLALLLLNSRCSTETINNENKSAKLNVQFTAAVWNMQEMFDGTDDGNEYSEYRAASGWTGEKYEARLLSAGQAILRMISSGDNSGSAADSKSTEAPDFLGLVELENAAVLDGLLKGPLSKQGYIHSFFTNASGMSLGTGVISRYRLTETKVHSMTAGKETTPRPILEVHLEPAGKPLVIFLCHWKSKVGGEGSTESLRRAAAGIIGRRIRELKLQKPGTPVIIMGDLNENHDEFYRRGGTALSESNPANFGLTALLPDDPQAADLARTGRSGMEGNFSGYFLVISGEKPPVSQFFGDEYPVLYTPWENELADGSYYYRDSWETIDHILLTEELFNGKDWEYDASRVINSRPFTNSKGAPNSYNPRTGYGLSDHLPLLLYLRLTPE